MVRPSNCSITLMSYTVIESEALAICSHRDNTGSECHHTHSLTRSSGTTEQTSFIVKNLVHDRIDVGLVASLKNKIEFLTKLFIDVGRFLKVRHLCSELIKADTCTRNRMHIKSRSLKYDREALGTLNPLKGNASLLIIREQFLTRIRSFILSEFFPICNELNALHQIENSHLFCPPLLTLS